MGAILSIITPTYNCASFIERSYTCLLNQTFEKWEWIIVDDGSTDNTSEVVNCFDDERIIYFSYDKNQGRGYARNYAISKTSTDYIVVWDIDDLYLPNRLQLIYEKLVIEKYDYFISKALIVDNELNVKGVRGEYTNGLFKEFVHPTLAFKRSLDSRLNYDVNMRAGEDFEVIVLLSSLYSGYYYNSVLMLYFEDREVNLHKTINANKSRIQSISRLFDKELLNISFLQKKKELTKLYVKYFILNVLRIYPKIYLKSVKYRIIENVEMIDSDVDKLINFYKNNEK